MVLVDANVILRYLLNDIPDQARIARDAIDAGVFITIEVIAEVVYVLQGVYEVPREMIAHTLSELCARLSSVRTKADTQQAYRALACPPSRAVE